MPAAVEAQLNRMVPDMDLQNTPLSDAIDRLRDSTGLNIFVNWRGLGKVGISRVTSVSVHLRRVTLSKALGLILEAINKEDARLGFGADDGTLVIDTRDNLDQGRLITRVYDIRDLIVELPDFTAPDFDSVTPPAGGVTRPAADQRRMTRAQLIEAMITLIKETVAPDSWQKLGQIRELSGQLIVSQTPENHASMVHLLEQLRKTRGIQVTMESRFLVVDKALAAKITQPGNPSVGNGKADKESTAGVFLSRKQVNDLLREVEQSPRTIMIASPRITCFNGQQSYVMIGGQTPYVSGYSVTRGNNGQTTYDPIRRRIDTGVLLELQPTVSADRTSVTVTVHPVMSRLDRMDSEPLPDSLPGQKLVVEHPVITALELRLSASIPDGATLMLSDFTRGGNNAATQPANRAARTQPDLPIDEILDHLGPEHG